MVKTGWHTLKTVTGLQKNQKGRLKYTVMNENDITTDQNLQNITILRGKFIMIDTLKKKYCY